MTILQYLINKKRSISDSISIHIIFFKATWERYKHITTDARTKGKTIGDIITNNRIET